MWVFLSILLCFGGSAIALYIFFANGHQSYRQILIDLGLQPGVGGKVQAPFYKWGWRKQSAERVWAENIVKEAFRKAKIWLSAEDLKFFEAACKLHAQGKKPNDEKIIQRVKSITDRMDALRMTVANQVREVMQRIQNTTLTDAKTALEGKGIHVDEHLVMSRYGTYHIRQKLASLGSDVLGYEAKGFSIQNEKGGILHKMLGMASWKTLLNMYVDETQKQVGKLTRGMKSNTFLSIERQLTEGVLNDYEDDVILYQKFIDMLEKEMQEKTLECEIEEIERIESIFYKWQFTEGVPMNLVDHKRIRKLLCNKELAGRFREIIIDSIKPDFKTAMQLLKVFPRSVIFHGKNKDARAFASEIYQVHFRRMLEAFAPLFGVDHEEPALVQVSLSDFNNVMKEETAKSKELVKYSNIKGIKQSDESFDVGKLTKLLDYQKRILNKERNLTEDTAEKKGWIVNIPISDNHPEAFKLFEVMPYKIYNRFNCDSAGTVDFQSRNFQARKQREIFFNLILDMLTNRAELNGSGDDLEGQPSSSPKRATQPEAVAV